MTAASPASPAADRDAGEAATETAAAAASVPGAAEADAAPETVAEAKTAAECPIVAEAPSVEEAPSLAEGQSVVVAAESAATEPANAEPATAEPATVVPESVETAAAEPIVSAAVAADPVAAVSAAVADAVTTPVVAAPVVAVAPVAAAPAAAPRAPKASDAPAPACLYLLADHLDSVLASGEDLLQVAVSPRASDDVAGTSAAARAELREAVERVRALELRMLARALKARERASELAAADDRFVLPARLFIGGTGALADAVAECADASVADFETGDALPAYLRSRGLIDARQCRLPDDAALAIGEDFLVAGRIPLGALLDLVAAFLDALELHVDLFVDAAPLPSAEDAVAAA